MARRAAGHGPDCMSSGKKVQAPDPAPEHNLPLKHVPIEKLCRNAVQAFFLVVHLLSYENFWKAVSRL